MAEATVQMRGIRKQFPSCLANDNVDFTAYRGEIHALLGENGAGKSTLMSILTGVLQPDAGEICINGKPVMIRTPKDALQHGIGMIYQHFKLVKPFSVAENIVLGDDHVKVINKKKLEARVKALSERYCIEIDPGALTWQLSIGEQQRVEILKVLYRNANILILDEPTAVLTAQEVQELFLTLRKMTDSGCTVIFITHKMNEVMDYADRITILRDGCLVRTLTKAETDEKELAKLMVGREISMGRRNTTDTTTDRELLRVENLTVLNDKKLEAVRKLSFSLYAGEILGIAGVSGNGQKELMEALSGLRAAAGGTITFKEKNITKTTVRQRISDGLAFIPEDRYGFASVRELSVAENASIKSYRLPEFSKGGIVDYKKLNKQAEEFIDKFEIRLLVICTVDCIHNASRKLVWACCTCEEPRAKHVRRQCTEADSCTRDCEQAGRDSGQLPGARLGHQGNGEYPQNFGQRKEPRSGRFAGVGGLGRDLPALRPCCGDV